MSRMNVFVALLTCLATVPLEGCSPRGGSGGGDELFTIRVLGDLAVGPCGVSGCVGSEQDAECSTPFTVEEFAEVEIDLFPDENWLLAVCGDIWIGQERTCRAANLNETEPDYQDRLAISQLTASDCAAWGAELSE